MENYNNENQGSDFVDSQPTVEQTEAGNQDMGATDQDMGATDMNSGDAPTATDDTSAPQDASKGFDNPTNYQGEQGVYKGDQPQTDSGYGAGDDAPAQDVSAPGYGDKSEVGETDATDAFDQPTTDQTQFGHDGGADTDTTNGYDATTQPPSAPADEMAAPPPPPKKESFITKLKDKLPGHHKSSDDETAADDEDLSGGPPKQGLMTKIKEKIHI